MSENRIQDDICYFENRIEEEFINQPNLVRAINFLYKLLTLGFENALKAFKNKIIEIEINISEIKTNISDREKKKVEFIKSLIDSSKLKNENGNDKNENSYLKKIKNVLEKPNSKLDEKEKTIYRKFYEVLSQPKPVFFTYDLNNNAKSFKFEVTVIEGTEDIISYNLEEVAQESLEEIKEAFSLAKKALCKDEIFYKLEIKGNDPNFNYKGHSTALALYAGLLHLYEKKINIKKWAFISSIDDCGTKTKIINTNGIEIKLNEVKDKKYEYVLVAKENNILSDIEIFIEPFDKLDEIKDKINLDYTIRKGKQISQKLITDYVFREYNSIEFSNNLYPKFKNDEKENLFEILKNMWFNGKKEHLFLKGEGGIGKSSNVINLAKLIVQDEYSFFPLPIYIPLNQYTYKKDINFIDSFIKEHYNEDILKINKTLLSTDKQFMPSILLILDGINEVLTNKQFLEKEIVEWSKKENCQLIINSREDIKILGSLGKFKNLEYSRLDDTTVTDFLKSKLAMDTINEIKKNQDLFYLLHNTFMLKIFVDIHEIKNTIDIQLNKNINTDFNINEIKTEGETLDYFLKIQELKIKQNFQNQNINNILISFIFKIFLPMTAFYMDEKSLNYIDENNLNEILSFFKKDIDENAQYKAYVKAAADDDSNQKDFINSIKKLTTEDIETFLLESMLVIKFKKEEQIYYEFIHQNYKDFFYAKHIFNDMTYNLKYVLKEKTVKEYYSPPNISR